MLRKSGDRFGTRSALARRPEGDAGASLVAAIQLALPRTPPYAARSLQPRRPSGMRSMAAGHSFDNRSLAGHATVSGTHPIAGGGRTELSDRRSLESNPLLSVVYGGCGRVRFRVLPSSCEHGPVEGCSLQSCGLSSFRL